MMKTFTKIFIACLLALSANLAVAQTPIYVKGDAGGANNGSSWNDAFNNLQDALTLAGSSPATYEVRVAKGTYFPSITPIGATPTTNFDRTFVMPSALVVKGGYKGDVNGSTERNFKDYETILSGDIGGGIRVYHVVIFANTVTQTTLDGFTVEGGATSAAAGTITVNSQTVNRQRGGGVAISYAGATLKNLVLRDNSSSTIGAGIGVTGRKDSSSPILIENCIFESNTASNGGGFGVSGASGNPVDITFLNCYFKSNSSGSTPGGAFYSNGYSNAIIVNSVFYNNTSLKGSAIAANANSSTGNIINCTFYYNRSSGAGGAVNILTGSIANYQFTNSIFSGNEANAGNADINKESNTSTIKILNSITQTLFTTDVANKIESNYNTVNSTPAQVFASVTPTDPNFLHLIHSPNNPAIDKGDNAAYNLALYGNKDLTGANNRIFDSGKSGTDPIVATIDMGAYENVLLPLPITLISFTGKAQNNAVQLTWITSAERDNSYFVLERSIDGEKFTTIGKVSAKGVASTYNFKDVNALNGANYYRLSQVDIDGTKVSFAPIAMNLSFNKVDVVVFPNPAVADKTTVTFKANTFKILEVSNLSGQKLQTIRLGINDVQKEIDLSKYSNGTFFIRLIGDKTSSINKLVK